MVRNGFFMPHVKQAICTIKWFEEIRSQASWCPKQSDLARNFQIARTPTKAVLAQLLHDSIEDYIDGERVAAETPLAYAMLKTADLVLLRPPDCNWLINVLGILEPDHAIFSRDYLPPKPQMNKMPAQVQFVNDDHFFDNLPLLNAQQLQHRALAIPRSAQI